MRVQLPPQVHFNKIMSRRILPPKYFIWTPKLAYVVGLLVTDGNLSSDGKNVVMRSAELEMLNTFKCCLGIDTMIGKDKNRPYYRVQYCSVQFYDWLLKIGLFPAKSYTIGEIAVPDEFFRDYFRGCIDGDGSIQTYRDEYNSYKDRTYTTQRLFIKLVSASQKHIVWLQQKIESLTQVKGFICVSKPKNEKHVPLWQLKFAKKDSLQLIEWMYYNDDVPCLTRKRLIAETAKEIISKQQRREYARVDKLKIN